MAEKGAFESMKLSAVQEVRPRDTGFVTPLHFYAFSKKCPRSGKSPTPGKPCLWLHQENLPSFPEGWVCSLSWPDSWELAQPFCRGLLFFPIPRGETASSLRDMLPPHPWPGLSPSPLWPSVCKKTSSSSRGVCSWLLACLHVSPFPALTLAQPWDGSREEAVLGKARRSRATGCRYLCLTGCSLVQGCFSSQPHPAIAPHFFLLRCHLFSPPLSTYPFSPPLLFPLLYPLPYFPACLILLFPIITRQEAGGSPFWLGRVSPLGFWPCLT